jgi:hypothetical protein
VVLTDPGGRPPNVPSKLWHARPRFFKLLAHFIRAAASLTFCTAGNNNPIRIAIMAITTNNSIRVKPLRVILNMFFALKIIKVRIIKRIILLLD